MDAEQLRASTIASAIEINRPVNLKKCLRALDVCDGVVRQVSDQEIMDAKARVGAGGLGCEPASAASVAGAKLLREEGHHRPERPGRLHPDRPPAEGPDRHGRLPLGRPGASSTASSAAAASKRAGFANRPVLVPNDLDDIIRAIDLYSEAPSNAV